MKYVHTTLVKLTACEHICYDLTNEDHHHVVRAYEGIDFLLRSVEMCNPAVTNNKQFGESREMRGIEISATKIDKGFKPCLSCEIIQQESATQRKG